MGEEILHCALFEVSHFSIFWFLLSLQYSLKSESIILWDPEKLIFSCLQYVIQALLTSEALKTYGKCIYCWSDT